MLQVPIKIGRQIKSDSWRENPQVFHTYFTGLQTQYEEMARLENLSNDTTASYICTASTQVVSNILFNFQSRPYNAFKKVIENLSRIVFFVLQIYQFMPIGQFESTLYNVILRTPRNFLETRENIKISTHPFYHTNLD